jgi:streptogrisin C
MRARLNRLVIAAIMMVAAVIGTLAIPALATAVPARAPVVIRSPARGADAAALNIVKEQHVSLAQAEIRLSWQRSVPSLNTALSRQLPAAAFGGLWIAPNDGDRVKVGVVGADRRIQATVMRAVSAAGLSAATDIVPVRYSARQVVAADAWLASQLDKLAHASSGPIHLDVSYRMDLNRVQLGVAGRSLTAAEQALVTRAKARYGDLLQVVAQPSGSSVGTSLDCTYSPGTPAYPRCFPPLRGGVTIFTNPSSTQHGGTCTGAFLASDRTTGQLYQFTAGHCAVNSGTGTWWTYFKDGTQHAIGTVHNYIFGPAGDMAILNINNPSGWMLPQGWVNVMAGSNTTLNERYPITSAQYSTQGARICETGAISGTICGTVAQLGQSIPECEPGGINCVEVNNLGLASFCGNSGDSGAPVFASHQAFGLVVALKANIYGQCVGGTYYQGIIGAENAMNANIVLANNRPSPWPTGLQAVGVQDGVQLTWQDNSTNETSWIINGGTANRYMNVSNGSTTGPVSYTWTGMGSHQYLCFRVSAYNAWGSSGPTPYSGSLCAYSSSSPPCVLLEPDQVNCTSSNPGITLEGQNIGDTSGCTFSGAITWGDGSHQTVQYQGADNQPSFVADHTYAQTGTFSITLDPTVISGPCSAFSGTYTFTYS